MTITKIRCICEMGSTPREWTVAKTFRHIWECPWVMRRLKYSRPRRVKKKESL